MELPEDIRRKIETDGDWELITEIVGRLQGDGIKITHDVLAAIKMTLQLSDSAVE